MFSRGRQCLRRRLSAALDTVTAGPDEPLLFLYPQWAVSALRQRRPITSSTPATASVRSRRSRLHHLSKGSRAGAPSLPSFHRGSARWISSNAATARAHDGSGSEVIAAEKEDGSALVEGEELVESVGSDRDVESFAATSPKRPVKSLAHVVDVSSGSSKLKGQSVTGQTPTRYTAATASDGLDRQINPVKRMSVRDRRKLRNGALLREKDIHLLYRSHVGSWDNIKDLLEDIERDPRTVGKKGTKHKEILIPEETVALLAGIIDTGMKENIWYVPVHNGCRVHVLHPREGDGIHRRAILSGSEHVMALVEGRIDSAHKMQLSGDPLVEIPKPPVPVFASTPALAQQNKQVPSIRGIWSLGPRAAMPLDDVVASRPVLGSVKDFAEHIEDLTRARAPRIQRESQSQPEVPHQELIARQILRLFRQDSSHKFISTAALNRALIFLCNNDFLSTARAVFSRAEQVATVDTYNILLKSAARRQDKRGFRRFLRSMSRSHIRPNPQTWLALLEALVTPSAKASLIYNMGRKGYMKEIDTIRSALHSTIEDSLLVHLDSGQSMDSFIALMTRTSGADWFSPSLLAQMFAVIFRLENHAAMERLLKICTEHRLELRSDALVQIMHMFRADVFSALHYTIEFLNRPGFRLSREAYERLFLIAFSARRYNICRVLWRYACMGKSVTYKMKKTVLSSLTRNESVKNDSNEISKIWRLSAGKIIVGLDLHRESYSIPESLLNELPSEFREHPLLFLTSGFKAQGPSRDLQRRLANVLVDRDIQLGATAFKPRYHLAMMLESAAILDCEWADKPWPLVWMMQNAIEVSIEPRDDLTLSSSSPPPSFTSTSSSDASVA